MNIPKKYRSRLRVPATVIACGGGGILLCLLRVFYENFGESGSILRKALDRKILLFKIYESPVRKTGRFTHVSSKSGHDVRGKRFITHGRSNPRYKYLGRGILQFADSVLSLPVK